ncbi:helix-turn-helix domain-containing protein [uncultured Tolumonas sp.]|uniref:AraC family transcriptional regulator n=1 Tax=uncultured Tolumonas sp. TaxID=263765 RepID=UPI002A0A3985|nr:helix-turn-helix domain-containing protein [uncultured Tolumonas sp.]
MKSVSNSIINWKLKVLAENGIDVNRILDARNISEYELNKTGGRISSEKHFNLMYDTLKYNDIFLSKAVTMKYFYRFFPDLIGLCLNEHSALGAIEKFIQYRALIGNSDLCTIKNNNNTLHIEYINEGPNEFVNCSALGNFLFILDMLRLYLPDMSLTAGFAGKPLTSEKFVSEQLNAKCIFNQSINYLSIKSKALIEKSELYNATLNEFQKERVESIYLTIPDESLFSKTVTQIITRLLLSYRLETDSNFFDDICDELRQSRWTINRRLKREQTSFTDLLQKAKFNRACQLLTETDKSIQEISEDTCFATQATFSRFFNEHANISPMKYRQHYHNK